MAAGAFRLEVGARGLATLCFDLPGRSANLFTRSALEEFAELLPTLGGRGDIRCLVLISSKTGSFCHGVDVDLVADSEDPAEAEAGARFGQDLFNAWEALPFPTIAAIDGTCMGGGTELSLASTFRVASHHPDLYIGLPEIRIGIVPGWGGCTRLPRRIGLTSALELILSGKSMTPQKARKLGFLDALLPAEGFLHHVRDFALECAAGRPAAAGEAHLKELLQEKNPLGRRIVFEQARKKTLQRTGDHYPAPLRAIEVMRIGIEQGFRAGLDAEARAVGELATGRVCKNLLHVFGLQQEAKKDRRGADGNRQPAEAIRRTAVVGAGLMGRSIGYLIAEQTRIPVRLRDISPRALAQSQAWAAEQTQKKISRRRLAPARARAQLARLQPCLDGRGFRGVDLLIETIPEQLEAKRRVFSELAAQVRGDTILATNTSSLSVDDIFRGLDHPERCLGLHFFNPAHRMPLVEVVSGEHTSPDVLDAAIRFTRALGKTPIAVRDAPGFLVNRILNFYMSEALWLLEDGYSIEDLDGILEDWGMPQGPFALLDKVGTDVAVEVSVNLTCAFGDRLAFPSMNWQETFLEEGRLGAKAGAGFYRYDKGRPTEPDPDIYHRLQLGPRRKAPEPLEVIDRMLLPMANEAARCLEEGIVDDPGTLDLATVLGLGFPPFRGGPCRWADQQGVEGIVRVLDHLSEQGSERLKPSDALRRVAAGGGFYRVFG